MPANVGEMFYTGEVPWHGLGLELAKPATMEEALRAGGLNWEVGSVDLWTAEDPPSPAPKRKALVRLDRPPGHEGRVVGVAHRGFQPLQNRDGAMLFDAIFGQNRPVYHTGGYLGEGEVVWLLAQIDQTLKIGGDDIVKPYALFANSHDGSIAFNISLTTVRVVCQNTLQIAMDQRGFGRQFRRAHQGSFQDHAEAAREFFSATMAQLDHVASRFTALSEKRCDDEQFKEIVKTLLPRPQRPKNADKNPGLLRAWENRLAEVELARKRIGELRGSGKGADLDTARGTFWGALNAVLEFVDHHKEIKGSRVSYAVFGEGMELKTKAFQLIQEMAAEAA
ncbi:MAG TPA: DUF932 domain-containing protein [Candidatus Hydrogenedentes bacterium]|nr:DUF932 domain-containing protein [Candidatus Hydrogenedentota bacterium]